MALPSLLLSGQQWRELMREHPISLKSYPKTHISEQAGKGGFNKHEYTKVAISSIIQANNTKVQISGEIKIKSTLSS